MAHQPTRTCCCAILLLPSQSRVCLCDAKPTLQERAILALYNSQEFVFFEQMVFVFERARRGTLFDRRAGRLVPTVKQAAKLKGSSFFKF